MREAVLDRRQRVADAHARRGSAPCNAARRRRARSTSGRLHSPAQIPAPGRFSSRIVPARSSTSTRTARDGRAFAGRGDGNVRDATLAPRDAVRRDGTLAAARRRPRAERRAEIHQRLRVGFDAARGQQRFRDRPQPRLDLRRAGKAVDAAMAREHALHVAVEDRGALAERERRDRRRGRAADARQRGDGVARRAGTGRRAARRSRRAAACR